MIASPGYFDAMNIPVLRGRGFSAADDLGAPTVVIINQLLAQRLWPNADPLGRRISDGDDEWATIVGVVASVRQQLALEPVAEIYVPAAQLPFVTTSWALRTDRPVNEIAPAVRGTIRAIEPNQPIHRLQPLSDVRAASLLPPRLTAALIGLFAALALAITATGIAGVIAFSVNQRTQEFGVRFALGAAPADVVSLVVGEGLRLALAGLAIGAAGAFVVGEVFSTLLFQVTPTDGVTYLAVSIVLLAVAALACLLPALRAAAVDPMDALRPA
jgi:predicted permease